MAQGLHAEEARAFSARLKQALEAAGVRPSPAVVASEFNLRYWGKCITAHTARAWLAGLAIPMQDKIRTLSEWLHGNPDELRFGARSGPVLAMDSGTLESLLNLQDRQMLAQYLALPVGHRTRRCRRWWLPWRLPPRMRNRPRPPAGRSISRRSDRKRRSARPAGGPAHLRGAAPARR